MGKNEREVEVETFFEFKKYVSCNFDFEWKWQSELNIGFFFGKLNKKKENHRRNHIQRKNIGNYIQLRSRNVERTANLYNWKIT